MELKVLKKEIGALAINYEELKQELTKAVTLYDNIKVVDNLTEDCVPLHTTEEGITIYQDKKNNKVVTFSDAKGIRAKLNKVSKVINDRKKELKQEFLRPYEIVDRQAKELMSIIENVNEEIDKQVKQAEDIQRAEKIQAIIDLWSSKNYNQVGISFAHVLDPKWTNKSISMAQVAEEMADKYLQFKNELEAIEKLVPDKKKALLLKTKYCLNPNLSKIISDYNEENEKAKELLKLEKEFNAHPDTEIQLDGNEDLDTAITKFKVTLVVDEFQLSDLLKFCEDRNIDSTNILQLKEID
jgi:hypothetical protein